jgi:transcriptional regulator with XRE-family HTH domain
MPYPYNILPQFDRGLVRLRVTPDEPTEGEPAIVGQRPQGSRRPHTDTVVAKVRHLIENTVLTYDEIVARTGVGRASISRWARDGAWVRRWDAPIATDRMPTARAGQKLKMRKLAERLRLLAERYVRDLEERPDVDLDRLMQALQVLKMARLEAQGRHRRRRFAGIAQTGLQLHAREDAIRTALKEMRRGGVDIDLAPQEALDLLIAARTPLQDHPALRERGSGGRRVATGSAQFVMPGLVPGIHVLTALKQKTQMARTKPGHDGKCFRLSPQRPFSMGTHAVEKTASGVYMERRAPR